MALRPGVKLVAPLELGRQESERQPMLDRPGVRLRCRRGSGAIGMVWHDTTVTVART